MIISVIVATDRRGLIGRNGRLPWYLPRDLRRFKDYTWGKPVIMGRRTLESIGGRLKGRHNIVLTRNLGYVSAGCMVAHSVQDALDLAEAHLDTTREVMVIGGGVVFREMMPFSTRAYITLVDGEFAGDTHFPLDEFNSIRWKLEICEHCPPDIKNPYPHWFMVANRQDAPDSTAHDLNFARWIDRPSPLPCPSSELTY
jgi:dihydrofolate reductase